MSTYYSAARWVCVSAGLVLILVSTGVASKVPPIVDGRDLWRDFGAPIWEQTIGTGFGNNTEPTVDYANGSELDGAFVAVRDGVLYIALSGNLETNFNKLEFFFDVMPGGQNKLRGDNPDVDYDGLNRMGDDGSGNGLTFDADFEADYFLGYTTGIGMTNPEHYVNAATLPTEGGGEGLYVGGGEKPTVGTIEGIGPNGGHILINIDNRNILGVNILGAPFDSNPDTVDSGVELAIDLDELGWDGESAIRFCAFINGAGHDFVSNQVTGGLPDATANLGEPRDVDFSAIAGDQYLVALAGRDEDYDGDGLLDGADFYPFVFDLDIMQELRSNTMTDILVYQLSYEDTGVDPAVQYSPDAEFAFKMRPRFELLWLNVTINGIWAIQNAVIYPIEYNPYSVERQDVRVDFDLGVPAGTRVYDVDYEIALTRSRVETFPPAGITSMVAGVAEQKVSTGGFIADPVVFTTLSTRGDDIHQRPEGTRFIRADYKQADLKKPAHKKACAAGAVASSIKWLLDQYKLKNGKDGQPGTADDYDPSLDDLVDDFVKRMGITPSKGASFDDIVKAKKGFINDHGLPLKVESAKNTTGEKAIKDIYDQMKKGQDVELELIGASKGSPYRGHAVSLVGINKRKDENGKDVYDVVIRDDENQTKPRGEGDPPNGRRRASDVSTTPTTIPKLPGLKSGIKHIYGWTAESPTKNATVGAYQFVAEETAIAISTALSSGGTATYAESMAIAAGGAESVYLANRLIEQMDEQGYIPGTPEREMAEVIRLNAIYLRRATFDVIDYFSDPAAQNGVLVESEAYAWDQVNHLLTLTGMFPPDQDRDDVPDDIDNCEDANPDQLDCNSNGIGDVCELNYLNDCDSNGFLDECELADGSATDCNDNGIIDACDAFADFDGDGVTDLDDYVFFETCITGPCLEEYCEPPLYADACCSLADEDADGDVDLSDFAAFQELFLSQQIFGVDWCILQFPPDLYLPIGYPATVYGRLYIAGLTDRSPLNDPHPNVLGEVGYGPDSTDPENEANGWVWFPGTPNPGWDGYAVGEPNNDEYWADLIAPPIPGLYDFCFRFSGDGGLSWTYADLDGSHTGYQTYEAGNLEVNGK